MRDVFEAYEHGPGVQLICNIGPGGEPVRLVNQPGHGATLVTFVPTMGPGVAGVNVVEGGRPRAEMAWHAAGSAAAEMSYGGEAVSSAPSVDEMSDADHAVMGALSDRWSAQQQASGPAQATAMRAVTDEAQIALRHEFTDPNWQENVLMMAANATVWLHDHGHHQYVAEVGPTFLDAIARRGWRDGGPTNLLEAHEVSGLEAAVAASQAVGTAPPPLSVASQAERRRGFFRR